MGLLGHILDNPRVSQGEFRSGFHTVGNCRPLSKFMIFSLNQLDVDSLDCSSLPVACHTAPLHPGTIPVNRVVQLMGMDCDAVLWVSTLHRLLVLTESHLERPPGLTVGGLMAFFTWNLWTTPLFLSPGMRVLIHIRVCLRVLADLKTALTPRGVHTLSSFSLESLNIGETQDPHWVLTCRFRGGSGMGSTGECLLHHVLRKPLAWKTLWRCWRSGFLDVKSQIQWARLCIHLSAPVMVSRWWCEWKGMQRSVWVGLRQIPVHNLVSLLVMSTSRIACLFSFLCSI